MRCKKHSSDPTTHVGVCAICLRHRLSQLNVAQSHSQHQHQHQHQPPPLLFPRSVSPYHPSQSHLLFYSTPQQLPSSNPPHFTTTESFPTNVKKASLFSSFFRSKSQPQASPSTIRNFFSSSRKKQPSLYTVKFPGRRNHQPSDRGMSPVERNLEYEVCDRSASGSGCSSDSPDRWRKTPTPRRGKHGRNAYGMAFCLSPLVRVNPNRKAVAGIPPDIRLNGKENGKPHLSVAASYCPNRSRKLTDFGRVNRNR